MAKLYYFEGRGRAELIRLTLGAAGIEFTEEFCKTREQFLKWKDDGLMLYDQLPVLKIDGKSLTQTNSIVRYLGRKAGMCGKDDNEAVLVDMYYEGARDFMASVLPVGFLPEAEVLQNCKDKSLPKYLPIFNKIASENGTGYLVGNSLTLADLSLLEPLLAFVEYFGKEILDGYPGLQTFFNKVSSEPRIASFLSGPQRKKKNDEKYVTEVKLSLGRV